MWIRCLIYLMSGGKIREIYYWWKYFLGLLGVK
jgi:neutral trehalase